MQLIVKLIYEYVSSLHLLGAGMGVSRFYVQRLESIKIV